MIKPPVSQSTAVKSIRRLTPATRLICGVTLLAITLIAPVDSWKSTLLPVALTIGWTLLCRVSAKHLASALLLAACMFSPYLLLAPYTYYRDDGSWLEAVRPLLVIGLRGTLSLLTCLATYTALNPAELRQALHTLPIPRIISALLLQINHQTAMLRDETSRMLAAYRLRGIISSGLRLRMRCLCASPVLWLLRLTVRAERVADAMDLRGFTGFEHTRSQDQIDIFDVLARTVALLALIALIATISLRIATKH